MARHLLLAGRVSRLKLLLRTEHDSQARNRDRDAPPDPFECDGADPPSLGVKAQGKAPSAATGSDTNLKLVLELLSEDGWRGDFSAAGTAAWDAPAECYRKVIEQGHDSAGRRHRWAKISVNKIC